MKATWLTSGGAVLVLAHVVSIRAESVARLTKGGGASEQFYAHMVDGSMVAITEVEIVQLMGALDAFYLGPKTEVKTTIGRAAIRKEPAP